MKKIWKWLFTNWEGEKPELWANIIGFIIILLLLLGIIL